MTWAMRLILAVSVLGQLCLAMQVVADGLIFSLPADGTWVEYSGTTESNRKVSLPPEVMARMDQAGKDRMRAFTGPQKMHETVRVSSVGVDQYGSRTCRWIELRRAVKVNDPVTKAEQSKPAIVLKLLVPEKYLTRGANPLESSNLTFFNPKSADVARVPNTPGFDRIRYEIERFLPCFPPPLAEEKRLPNETIVTPVGTFEDCEVIRGKAQFDHPLLNAGRWEEQATWTIALHRKAPFGVVRVKSEGFSAEISGNSTLQGSMDRELTISAKGENAVTELPKGKLTGIPTATGS